MFDDPKKELQRLQSRLLAAEEEEWQVPDPTEDDPDKALADVKRILARDDWEEKHREPLSRSYTSPEEAEEEEESDEDYPENTEKKSHFGGLLIALVLETLALVGVVTWWLLWR